MTATIVENEQDLFESLDLVFDEEFACEGINTEGCPIEEAAAWRVRLACCPRIYMLCEDCLFRLVEVFRNYRDEGGTCAACHESFTIDADLIIVLGRVK